MSVKEISAYNKIVFDDKNLKISVCPDRKSWIDENDDYSGFFHEELEMKYFYEGSCTILIDNKRVNVKKGDFVFMNPYQIHSTVSIGDVGAKYHLIMMSLDFFSDGGLLNLRQLFTEKRIGIKNIIENNERIKHIVGELVFEYTEKGKLYDIAVKGLAAELFAILFRNYCEKLDSSIPTDKGISKHKVIIPAINKIHSDYAKHITVDELAYECNISKYHFCRLFKEARGMTALEYLLRHRLHIADILLENTDKSIADIASLCGFEDASYFSRCYKKYNGNTPKTKRAI